MASTRSTCAAFVIMVVVISTACLAGRAAAAAAVPTPGAGHTMSMTRSNQNTGAGTDCATDRNPPVFKVDSINFPNLMWPFQAFKYNIAPSDLVQFNLTAVDDCSGDVSSSFIFEDAVRPREHESKLNATITRNMLVVSSSMFHDTRLALTLRATDAAGNAARYKFKLFLPNPCENVCNPACPLCDAKFCGMPCK